MLFSSWLRTLLSSPSRDRRAPGAVRQQSGFRPRLESLEGRDVPSFAAPVSYGGRLAGPVVAANFLNHSTPDLFAVGQTNTGAASTMFLNNGNGVFGVNPIYQTGGSPATALAVGDVTSDGNADVVLASSPSDPWGGISTNLTVLKGNGSGGLASIGYVQGFSWGKIISLTLADINRDGKLDLLAASSQGTLYVALGAGNGSFHTSQSLYGFGPGARALKVADINGDGKPDVVMNYFGGVSVLLNTGNTNGTLASAQNYALGWAPAAVAVGDVTGDGTLDIVTASTNGTVSVLPGQGTGLGNGTFGAVQNYTVGGPVNSVALGDFDHNGRLDIATTGSAETDVLFNNPEGFAASQKVGPAGSGLVAADLNGDGSPDLAEIDAATGNLEVLLNNANWTSPSFAVAGFPATTTAGVAQSFTVTARNADGSVNTGYSGTVHFTSSDPQAVLPANATLTNGVGTFQATLKKAGTQSITATDTATGRVTGNEWGITVNAGAAAALVFSYNSGGTTAGGSLYLILVAKDAYGNTATGYAGTVHFTSSDPRAVLPADYTFGSGDAGQHSFSPSLVTAGTQSVTVADISMSSLTGTAGEVVTPAAVVKFVLSAPTSVQSGAKFTLTLTAVDAYGNVTGYPGGTLHFSSSDGTAKLPADDTITLAGSSVFTFTNAFTLKKKGVQTITVTDLTNSALTGTVSITVT